MAKVSKTWIREHVDSIHGFGGQITKEDVVENARPSGGIPIPRGGFDTTLSQIGITQVESGKLVGKFNILLPNTGWADAITYGIYDES